MTLKPRVLVASDWLTRFDKVMKTNRFNVHGYLVLSIEPLPDIVKLVTAVHVIKIIHVSERPESDERKHGYFESILRVFPFFVDMPSLERVHSNPVDDI